MPAKRTKLLAWSDEADELLAAARAHMPDGATASESAVVRYALANLAKRRTKKPVAEPPPARRA